MSCDTQVEQIVAARKLMSQYANTHDGSTMQCTEHQIWKQEQGGLTMAAFAAPVSTAAPRAAPRFCAPLHHQTLRVNEDSGRVAGHRPGHRESESTEQGCIPIRE